MLLSYAPLGKLIEFGRYGRQVRLCEAWLHGPQIAGLAVSDLTAHDIARLAKNRDRYQVMSGNYKKGHGLSTRALK